VALTVLVVDDNPRFRTAAAELLTALGFEVLATAADASEALAAAVRTCPDGVLLDINLPGTDGFVVAASLTGVCPSAKIVLTSANVAYVPAELLRRCTAAAFVSKEELAAADLGMLFRPGGT
jgi:CheY-like chemotaxis protein